MTKLSRWKTGCAAVVLCLVGAGEAQVFETLAIFEGTNGSWPYLSSLVQGSDGALYGNTLYGGYVTCDPLGCGTIFKITTAGTLSSLFSFCAETGCPNGYWLSGSPLLGADGNLYGTTRWGGANGNGTVFKINSAEGLTILYDFCVEPGCADGSVPVAGLTRGADGDVYGTTAGGGQTGCDGGCGTIFKITGGGTLTTIYTFCFPTDCSNGANPNGDLSLGIDGNLYGTTLHGGSGGVGTVFKITPTGKLTTLHSFGSSDGAYPLTGLYQALDGDFYGETSAGGRDDCSLGCGIAFKISSSGRFTTLYNFCSQVACADGYLPAGGLIQATDGAFYGTAASGGAYGGGVVFKLASDGSQTVLHSFDGTDGASPYTGMVQATNGTLYGTTTNGGTYSDGTVFSLSVGLGPFVSFVRPAGKVGQTGPILGQGFTGTTSVSLNGVPASFTVVSDTSINATVPPGATTGFVTVVTPSGTLISNVPFRVIP